jgi:hypothetical protein
MSNWRNYQSLEHMSLTKSSQTPPRWFVITLESGLVHSDQLEDKVRQSRKEDDHDKAHGNLLLPSCTPSSKNQEGNGKRNDSNSEKEFIILSGVSKGNRTIAASGGNNDNKLNSEPHKKEKIKLEKGDEDLGEISAQSPQQGFSK